MIDMVKLERQVRWSRRISFTWATIIPALTLALWVEGEPIPAALWISFGLASATWIEWFAEIAAKHNHERARGNS